MHGRVAAWIGQRRIGGDMDGKKRTKIYKTILGYNKKYLSNPNLDNHMSSFRKIINKNINKKDVASIRTCLGYYRALSHWHAEKAQAALLAGDSSAWNEIDQAFHYRYYDMRFDACVTTVELGAILLLHAIAKRDRQKADWLFAYQLNSFRTNNPNTWSYSAAGVFGLMLMHKLGDARFDPFELGKHKHSPNMEAFTDILDNWENPEKVEEGIVAACDYHLKQTQILSGYPDYQLAPYFAVPIEIIALISVREQLGLSTSLPNHVLINEAIFGSLPQFYEARGSLDEEYLQLLEKARAIVPEL